jgi:hypothetical protein
MDLTQLLPRELLTMIMAHLSGLDLLHAALVCKAWSAAACSARDTRNRWAYQIIVDEVLAKFSAVYWTVAGSASLWLWLYVNGRNPFWTPGDVDVWFIGQPGSRPLLDFYDRSEFADPDAQPADVLPFQLRHAQDDAIDLPFHVRNGPGAAAGSYRSGSVIYRRGMGIHVLLSPGAVGRSSSGTPRCQFDIRFLQIAVNLSPDKQQFLFYFTSQGSSVMVTQNRIDKYSARFDGDTWSRMSSMVFVLGNNDDAIVVPRAIF